MGFSTIVATPAAASASATSSWWTVGTATTAASRPAAMSASTSGSTGRSPATPNLSPTGIGDRDELHARRRPDHAGVVAAHRAEPDDAGAQRPGRRVSLITRPPSRRC